VHRRSGNPTLVDFARTTDSKRDSKRIITGGDQGYRSKVVLPRAGKLRSKNVGVTLSAFVSKFRPVESKYSICAKIATSLINGWKDGTIAAMIARAADFYGPET
jgi:hypothetical protein